MKRRIVMTVIVAVLAAAVLGVSIWLITVDALSRKSNLIKIDVEDVPQPVTDEQESRFIQLSEFKMHYTVCGEGAPLVLVHGNGGSHKSFDELIPYLANDYTVYALDSRCQGESGQTDEISYALMAKDVAEFIEKSGLEKPYLAGHSDGGIIALQLAMDYPNSVRAIVAYGANSKVNGLKSYFTTSARIRYAFKKNPLTKIMFEEPCYSAEQLAKIKVPAYIVAGEFDIVKLKDTQFIADSIPNAKIAIIKWQGHSYIRNGKAGYKIIADYFKSL